MQAFSLQFIHLFFLLNLKFSQKLEKFISYTIKVAQAARLCLMFTGEPPVLLSPVIY